MTPTPAPAPVASCAAEPRRRVGPAKFVARLTVGKNTEKSLDLELRSRVYGGSVEGLLISELAESAGISASAVRFYERRGLVPEPSRSASGYRLYDEPARNRLLFITRAKQLGLALDDIAELLAVWDGSNCGAARAEVVRLVDDKLRDLRTRIVELGLFAGQLEGVRRSLVTTEAPESCSSDLNCCAPALSGPVALSPPTRRGDRKDIHHA